MIDKAWETFLDRTKEISRYYVGVLAETGEALYKHRDRVLAIAWKDDSEYFAYRGWSTENPGTGISGEDDRVSWLKSWIEERDHHDEAQINAWRAYRFLTTPTDPKTEQNIAGKYDILMAIRDMYHGQQLT